MYSSAAGTRSVILRTQQLANRMVSRAPAMLHWQRSPGPRKRPQNVPAITPCGGGLAWRIVGADGTLAPAAARLS